jgi:hypothetical protein
MLRKEIRREELPMSDNDDDGLPVTSVGPWTLEKHERLVRYVDITKSVRAKFTRTQSSYIAAQKSLDLWEDPTGGETASVRQLASLD